MRAIARRLARLEITFIPRENEASARLRERLRLARARLAEWTGRPYEEPSRLLPDDHDGRPLTLGERILLARREHIRSQQTAKEQ